MLVSKEIARKLRDIGFKESTDYAYDHYGNLFGGLGRKSENEWAILQGIENCDAPNKYQVFAWFRKKGIIGAVNYWVNQDAYYFSIKGIDNLSTGKYLSWEEAEDACILKMCELCTI